MDANPYTKDRKRQSIYNFSYLQQMKTMFFPDTNRNSIYDLGLFFFTEKQEFMVCTEYNIVALLHRTGNSFRKYNAKFKNRNQVPRK